MANKTVKFKDFIFIPEDRTVIAQWTFSESNVDHYEYEWWYRRADTNLLGETGTSNYKKIEYTAPTNATKCYLRVKPVGTDKAKWKGDWARSEAFALKKLDVPEQPSAPEVTIDSDYRLTATLDIYDELADSVKFQIVYDKNGKWVEYETTGNLDIKYKRVSYSTTVTAGKTYRVRCAAYNKDSKEYSDWSEFSGDSKTSAGYIPSGSVSVYPMSSTSVRVQWQTAVGADEYEVEYATSDVDFDTTSSKNVQSGFTGNTANIYGLTTGQDYFFRVRGKTNDAASGSDGYGPWSEIAHIVLGKKPTSPTTWSSTTVAMVGETVTLYWIHNSADNSKQHDAIIELDVNGEIITPLVDFDIPGDEEDEKTYSYQLATSSYTDGTIIRWRVRTKGILDEYSDWSVTRMIRLYTPPELRLEIDGMTSNPSGYCLSSYPFTINAFATPSTQSAIGYQIEITSLSQYKLFDHSGSIKRVNQGDTVYSKYFPATSNNQTFSFGPETVLLENTMDYKMKIVVSMDSGLHAESEFEFEVSYQGITGYNLEAMIVTDQETATCQIRPSCFYESSGEIVPNVSFIVLRREFDGTLTKIMDGIRNEYQSYIMDPHPALDYARYRIVAIFLNTGQVDFFDPSDEPMNITDIVINWDEMREGMPTDSSDDFLIDPRWVGGMLRLPYNIDVDDTMKPSVEIVEYIGREHGVAYYSPMKEHNSKWSVAVPKDDSETIRVLRNIGAWTDNVYVREPTGTGYWATIEINMSQKHNEPAVPISLTITRVEGGI